MRELIKDDTIIDIIMRNWWYYFCEDDLEVIIPAVVKIIEYLKEGE